MYHTRNDTKTRWEWWYCNLKALWLKRNNCQHCWANNVESCYIHAFARSFRDVSYFAAMEQKAVAKRFGKPCISKQISNLTIHQYVLRHYLFPLLPNPSRRLQVIWAQERTWRSRHNTYKHLICRLIFAQILLTSTQSCQSYTLKTCWQFWRKSTANNAVHLLLIPDKKERMVKNIFIFQGLKLEIWLRWFVLR